MPPPISTEDKIDKKWLAALKPYLGGGIVPFYRLPDNTINAEATINNFCMLHDIKKQEELNK